MKNKIFIFMAIVAMALSMNSCRETSDDFISYGQQDYVNFQGADTCYAGQFKTIWMALNSNYGIWDYEAEHGLDWDAVYDTYLPKMEELDKRDYETNPVTDETGFTFEHNQVGNNLRVQIDIFDIMGRWVTRLSETVAGTSTRTTPIRWNGRGANGEELRNGVYVYRIVATNDNGETSSAVSKLVLCK